MVTHRSPKAEIVGSIPTSATISKREKGEKMNVGSGFSGTTEKEKKQYISISFDKGLLALFPFLKNVKLTLWYVPKDERKSDKSPAWRLSMDEPYKPQETSQSSGDMPTDEEIPF